MYTELSMLYYIMRWCTLSEHTVQVHLYTELSMMYYIMYMVYTVWTHCSAPYVLWTVNVVLYNVHGVHCLNTLFRSICTLNCQCCTIYCTWCTLSEHTVQVHMYTQLSMMYYIMYMVYTVWTHCSAPYVHWTVNVVLYNEMVYTVWTHCSDPYVHWTVNVVLYNVHGAHCLNTPFRSICTLNCQWCTI